LNPVGFRNPKEKNLNYEDVIIRTSDHIQLKGWFIESPKDSITCPTVVFYHENAGNIGTRLTHISYYTQLKSTNVLIVAYRGYSESEGVPTEEGIKLDSIAILDFIF